MGTQDTKQTNALHAAPEQGKKQSSTILWLWVIAMVLCALLMVYKFIAG